jgi:integrase
MLIKHIINFTKENKMFDKLEEYYATLEINASPKTVKSYKWILDNFVTYYDIKTVRDVNKLDSKTIQEYLNMLATKNIETNEALFKAGKMDEKTCKRKVDTAKASANANARVIKVFLNWLESKKYIETTPFTKDIKKFKEAKVLKEFFDAKERDQIILACQDKLWLQVTMALLFYTGMRRAEIVNLRVSDFHDDHVTVLRKGNIEQDLYFPQFVTRLIKRYLRKRKDDCEYLLVGIRTHGQISEISLGNRVKEACRLAGIDEERAENVTAHSIRRSFACILFLEGKSTLAIQNCLNHSSSTVTELYVAPAKALMTGQIMAGQKNPDWYKEEED